MFTGIISDVGTILEVTQMGDTRYVIETSYDTQGIDIGASIACSGVCLTVIEKMETPSPRFAVEASAETLNVTTAKKWAVGTKLNLERALKMGDELGGHIVSGHVDGIAEIKSIEPDGDSLRFVFAAPEELAMFIASKGSVTLDGTSLTVNEVRGNNFGVNMIPHTQAVTTWGQSKSGDLINIEIDVLARYVARLKEVND
ncbi:MAG: riboflavin synthase [Rhizobiales bacterium TMED249]|jgi:riboflavin synthase|uniref:Riboflavin synthase n=1 Tax=PS1 clade bacterium TaxID=2175152 RepID=A0A368E0E2_9PROT|nr:MAG: riboflavin synthase [Rhizobiales bacterium TMED249]RCL77557.1 MAG: riboflavin synthase [PS1 clade bacterium]HAK98919.1 riboflavin synthase [Rhodobiaceae bacterium]|tara:strand:- start:443 stop:1042 length:600 start_codon:yes stop_codon:yes gene_type:complete